MSNAGWQHTALISAVENSVALKPAEGTNSVLIGFDLTTMGDSSSIEKTLTQRLAIMTQMKAVEISPKKVKF